MAAAHNLREKGFAEARFGEVKSWSLSNTVARFRGLLMAGSGGGIRGQLMACFSDFCFYKGWSNLLSGLSMCM